MSRPRVLVLADTPGWAWDWKARQYVRWLSDEFDIALAYHAAVPPLHTFDLVHLFEVSQLRAVPNEYDRPVIAGLTAMVWWTWGETRMRAWASRCAALHGNSIMLVQQLRQFHEHVYYTPNGVDPEFWSRVSNVERNLSQPLRACHVGKPNPRKGSALIVEACRLANVQVLMCQRTSQIRYTPEQIREFYRNTDVQISASDMDGTPNPMLEAASMSNALISTPIGNMPEFIQHNHNGFLVGQRIAPRPFRPWVAALVVPNPNELPEFAQWPDDVIRERRSALVSQIRRSVEWLMDNRHACVEIGRNARHTVLDAWTWERQVAHVAEMWRDVLSRSR